MTRITGNLYGQLTTRKSQCTFISEKHNSQRRVDFKTHTHTHGDGVCVPVAMCARKMSPTTVCSRTECAVVTPGFAVTRCTCRGDGVKPDCEEKLTFSQIYSCTCSDGSESGEETAAQLVGTGRTSCTEQLVGLDHS